MVYGMLEIQRAGEVLIGSHLPYQLATSQGTLQNACDLVCLRGFHDQVIDLQVQCSAKAVESGIAGGKYYDRWLAEVFGFLRQHQAEIFPFQRDIDKSGIVVAFSELLMPTLVSRTRGNLIAFFC